MPSTGLEDKVWPGLTASRRLSRSRATRWSPGWGASLFWWGVSGIVHLLLLVTVGWLTQHISDISQAPPIRVTIMPTMALSTEADVVPQPSMPERRPLDVSRSQLPTVDPAPTPTIMPPPRMPAPLAPERALALLSPETPPPEVLEVMPEVSMVQEPPPLLQLPQAVAPEQRAPDAVTPVIPVPPVVAQAPTPRLASPPPARKLPTQTHPPTMFDDPVVARIPPSGQNRREADPAAPPETGRQEPPPSQASLPRATSAQYGRNPRPSYPYEARRRGLEGTVLLVVEILESGRPERITIKQSSGHSVLDEAALGAVGRWSFIPAQREGKPVRSVAEVPIVFSLRKE